MASLTLSAIICIAGPVASEPLRITDEMIAREGREAVFEELPLLGLGLEPTVKEVRRKRGSSLVGAVHQPATAAFGAPHFQ